MSREQADSAGVGARMILLSPHSGEPTPVQYRGRMGSEAHVLIDGIGINVPLAWLSPENKEPAREE